MSLQGEWGGGGAADLSGSFVVQAHNNSKKS